MIFNNYLLIYAGQPQYIFRVKEMKVTIIVIIILSFVFISKNILRYSSERTFHEDEVTFLERGKFFDWYIGGELNREEWRGYESYDVPKYAEMFYGMVLRSYSGKKTIENLTNKNFLEEGTQHAGSWRTDWSRNFCCSIDDLPDTILKRIEPIIVARRFSVYIFTLPSLFCIYLIGHLVKNWLYGLISMILIGTNSLFLQSMTTAMADSPLIFFSLLFALQSLIWLKMVNADSNKYGLLLSVLLGLCGGLAISTKLNGGINIIYFLLILIVLFVRKRITIAYFLIHLFIVVSISYIVFFVINPFVWERPVKNTIYMVDHRLNTFHQQQNTPEFERDALRNISERIVAFNERMLQPEAYYSNFGKLNNKLHLDLILFLFGLYWMLINDVSKEHVYFKDNRPFLSLKVLKNRVGKDNVLKLGFQLWMLALFVLTVFFLPLDWDRYYMPLVLVVGFVQAFSINLFIDNIAIRNQLLAIRNILWKNHG